MGKAKNRVDKIREAQYNNLRECFRRNLIKPILGENYYNMGMDVYSCDEMTTLDLQQEFRRKDKSIYALAVSLIFSWLIILVLTATIIFN